MMDTAKLEPAPRVSSQADVVFAPDFLKTVRGIWGFTWRGFLAWRRAPSVLAVFFINPALAYLAIPEGHSEAFLNWTTNFYLQLLLPLYCLIVCGAMIRDEVQADTLGFLITRPVTRARLFVAKHLCHLAWLQIALLANGLLLMVVGMLRDIPEVKSLAWVLLGTQILATVAYSGLASVFGLITKRYVVLGIVYGFLVEIGIGHIPTNINSLSMMRHVRTLLANCQAIQHQFGWAPDGTLKSILIMALAAILLLGAGAALFTLKEYHYSDEAPK